MGRSHGPEMTLTEYYVMIRNVGRIEKKGVMLAGVGEMGSAKLFDGAAQLFSDCYFLYW